MNSYTKWGDYFWPDAPEVLRNRLRIKDNYELGEAENRITHVRMYQIVAEDPQPDTIDLDHYCGLHRRIFGDIYDWAGTPRTVPERAMTKNWRDVVNFAPDDRTAPWVTYRYYPGPEVAGRAGSQFTMMNFELGQAKNQAPHQLIPLVARFWGGLDAIHPFREGNTRSQTILFHQVCRKHGYELDAQELFNRREEFIGARFHGHATGQYGRLTALLLDTVRVRESERLSDREQKWAQSLLRTARGRPDSGLQL